MMMEYFTKLVLCASFLFWIPPSISQILGSDSEGECSDSQQKCEQISLTIDHIEIARAYEHPKTQALDKHQSIHLDYIQTELYKLPAHRTKREGRIVGGSLAQIQDHPYQLSLELLDVHVCGGAILKPDWIITAAHCFRFSLHSGYKVRSGTSTVMTNGTLHPVKQIIPYDGSSQCGPHLHDIALVRLETPISFDEYRQPLELFPKGGSPIAGSWANVTGWGLNERGITSGLRSLSVPILDIKECRELYKSIWGGLVDGQMCAGFNGEDEKSICAADDGGPLVVDEKLVGITSWAKSCGIPRSPAVYTNATAYVDWIEQHINSA